MPNIEKLFARELDIDDVRSVFPEYGFTETMAEHITTSAYATVASLLIYGAKRGSCAVAERPTYAGPAPERDTAPTRQTATPERDTQQQPEHTHDEEVAHETIKPIDPETGSMEDIEVEGDSHGGGFFGWMKDKFEKMGSAFAGNDDEQEL